VLVAVGALIVGTGKLKEALLVVLLLIGGEGNDLLFTALLLLAAVEIVLVVGTAALLEMGNGGVIAAAAAVRAAAKFMVAAEILTVEMLEPVEVVAVVVLEEILEEELVEEVLEILEVEVGVVLILVATGGVTETEIGLVAGVVEGRSIIKVRDSTRVGSKRGGISALITERRGSLLLT